MLKAIRKAKFQKLTFLPYNFHILLHKRNYDTRIYIWGRGVSQK